MAAPSYRELAAPNNSDIEKIKMKNLNKPSGDSVVSTHHTDDPPVSAHANAPFPNPASYSETSV